MIYCRTVGHVVGTMDLDHRSPAEHDPVGDRGSGGDQVEVVLALQALPHDLHVEEAQETAPESEAQRSGGFGLVPE